MRKLTAIALSVILAANSGCAAIRDELRHPGGWSGGQMDRRTFDASRSRDIQLFRAALIVAIAARIGERSVEPQDGDAFAKQLAEAAREVNFAAADAGFGGRLGTIDENGDPIYGVTCTVERGVDAPTSSGARPARVAFAAEDANCAGYYVNFEATITRIESRVIRAMLTSLPTDKAREFLDDIADGSLLTALWSLTQSFDDLAQAFHVGASVYRAGTENMAASMNGCEIDPSYAGMNLGMAAGYDQEYMSVMHAAACLGLSRATLFDSESADADDLPVYLDPSAFHAMFRIARTACVQLPLPNTSQLEAVVLSRNARRTACAELAFNPRMRPTQIPDDPEAEQILEEEEDDQQLENEEDEGSAAELEDLAPPMLPNL